MSTSATKIVLLDHMGSDLDIVNNAKASLDKASEWEIGSDTDPTYGKRLATSDRNLLFYLASHRHGTPFEAPVFRFHVDTYVRVAREWMRHRIGSFNEMSTRWTNMADERYNCFVPQGPAVRTQVGRSGNYTMEPITDTEKVTAIQIIMEQAYSAAFAAYDDLLTFGVAKEVAAYVLPLGMRTAFIWTVNLRSLFNFLSLRNSNEALREIRQPAREIEDIVQHLLPVTYEAWVACGRVPI